MTNKITMVGLLITFGFSSYGVFKSCQTEKKNEEYNRRIDVLNYKLTAVEKRPLMSIVGEPTVTSIDSGWKATMLYPEHVDTTTTTLKIISGDTVIVTGHLTINLTTKPLFLIFAGSFEISHNWFPNFVRLISYSNWGIRIRTN